MEKPGKSGQGQEGLSFANALGECFVCGLILVDNAGQIAALSSDAARILSLEPAQVRVGGPWLLAELGLADPASADQGATRLHVIRDGAVLGGVIHNHGFRAGGERRVETRADLVRGVISDDNNPDVAHVSLCPTREQKI